MDHARDELRAAGVHARKQHGQHFLIESPIVDQIISAAELKPGERVIEIGPGLGVLTSALVATGALVTAVEIDPEMVRVLEPKLAGWGTVSLVEADVLDFDVAVLAGDAPYRLVANLPYAITSPVLRRFLAAERSPERVVVMVQREVAQRIAARPGNWSYLAVLARLYGTPSIVCSVSRAAFFPAPKVESAVVRIDRHATPVLDLDDRAAFLEFVLEGFRHPRKQLHNSLSRTFWFADGELDTILAGAGIDPIRRAQTLTLLEWQALYRAFGDRLR